MNNTEKLIEKGCSFPAWINSEAMIQALTSLEGPELYTYFGYKDTTSCSKFLSKFIPGKGKSVRYNSYVKELLS